MVPNEVGGKPVDIMLGIQYNSYFPRVILTLPCGLAIHESILKAPGGCQGILGGPHSSWAHAEASAQVLTPRIFFTSELRALRSQSNALMSLFKDFQHFEADDEYAYAHGFETEVSEDKKKEESNQEERRTESVKVGSFPCADGSSLTTKEIFCNTCTVSNASPLIVPDGQNKFPVLCPQPLLTDMKDLPEIHCTAEHCDTHLFETGWSVPPEWNVDSYLLNLRSEVDRFENLEDVGANINYRCLRCRNCHDCKNGEFLEETSLQEELDQAHLESCVRFNPDTMKMEARLPFKQDPVSALPNNKFQAEKMLKSQLRSIAKRPGCKDDVLRAHNKLRDKGHVVAISDLPHWQREIVINSPGQYFIPWSVVYKLGSLSSPSRVVFNASMKTSSGLSLNSILAKGMNKLPKILHLLNKFGLRHAGFTADISLAYNSVKLLPEFFAYQKYLWAESLDINDPVVEMVVITLIYGVTPAGGMMTAGFEATANYAIEHFPQHKEGADVIKRSAYVDDLLKSCDTVAECHSLADSITFILGLAGAQTKGFTFSGSDPPEAVSSDGKSVGVLGYMWWPKEDLISLAAKDLCLGKSSRGKAPAPVVGDLRAALTPVFTRRILSGKVCGVFDPKGYVTPITSRIKLCLSEVVDLKLGWDDLIPVRYLDVWIKNLMDIQKLSNLRFPRCFVHPDAINDKVELVVSVDASMNIAVASVHARTELEDGSFACRLVCAKSKLVHLSTIPRGELRAAVMGATLAHVVKQDLGECFSKVLYVTDSTIVLSWLNQDQRPLHTLVRNAVIEIRRLTDIKDWFHIDSANNIADLGTRNCEVDEIGPESAWVNGHAWMRMPREQMPVKSICQIMLSQAERREASKEVKAQDIQGYMLSELKDKVIERYKMSNYLVDPCAHSWPLAVRILALVKRFVMLCSRPREARKSSENSPLTENAGSSDGSPAPSNPETCSVGTPQPGDGLKVTGGVDTESFLSLLRPEAIVFTPSLKSDCIANVCFDEADAYDANITTQITQPSCLNTQLISPTEIVVSTRQPSHIITSTQHVVRPALGHTNRSDEHTHSLLHTANGISALGHTNRSDKLTHSLIHTADENKSNNADSESDEHVKIRICIQLSTEDIFEAEQYFFRKVTNEVKVFSSEREYKHACTEVNGVLMYKGRILDGQEVDDVEQVMTDLNPLTFVRPVADRYSPVSYSVMRYVHNKLVHHRNATATLRDSRSILFILHGRDLANEVRDACTYCRRYKAKLLEVEMGNIHQSRLRISSAFTTVQVDMFGPYDARCVHKPHRATIPIWGVIFKCPASNAISACCMNKYDTEAFVLAYGRHANRYGHPVHLFVDQGSQILKACREMEISWADITYTLNAEHGVGVEYTMAPVLGHNQIGMVERSVREVKKLFNLVFSGLKLDSLAYESAFQFIANELNNLPICLGSKYNNLDHTDLITPSRLILGRNNRRAPSGYARIDKSGSSKSKQIEDMDNVHKSWWKVWQTESLVDYIPRPNKWIRTTRVPEVDDIVVYLEKDKETALGKSLWRLGRVEEVIISKDNGRRMVNIGYRNASEETWRTTWRSARKLAILSREGDLEMVDELNKAAKEAAVSLEARALSNWRCKSSFCTDHCIDAERHEDNVVITKQEE